MSNNYYHTKESVDQYIKMAEGYNGKHLIEILKEYTSGPDVLELGSGPGTDWDLLNNDYKVTGSDNSEEFLKRLKSKYPNGEFLKLNARTLLTDRKFHTIYSNKVLHHLNDQELEQSVKRQSEVLLSAGVICHSFWKGEGSENYDGMFVNNHTKESLMDYFGAYFQILKLEAYQEFESNDSLYLIAKKK